MATLVLEFKKSKQINKQTNKNLEVMMKQNIAPFIRPQRLKELLVRVILMIYLNQPKVTLHQTYKNLLKNVQVVLLI